MFNEVFFDGAFVPDDCVVGEVNHGWEAGRTTLANERVSMGSGSSFGPGVESILDLAARRRRYELDTELGPLLAEAHAIAVMALRSTLRALTGAKPGPGGECSQAHRRRTRTTRAGGRARAAGRGRSG